MLMFGFLVPILLFAIVLSYFYRLRLSSDRSYNSYQKGDILSFFQEYTSLTSRPLKFHYENAGKNYDIVLYALADEVYSLEDIAVFSNGYHVGSFPTYINGNMPYSKDIYQTISALANAPMGKEAIREYIAQLDAQESIYLETPQPATEEDDATIKMLKSKCEQISNPTINEKITSFIASYRTFLKQEESYGSGEKDTSKLYSRYIPMLEEILDRYIFLQDSGNPKEMEKLEERLIHVLSLMEDVVGQITSSLTQDEFSSLLQDVKALESKIYLDQKKGKE